MSDMVFERSVEGLTVLVIAWIVLGIIFSLLPIVWVVITGLIAEIVIGGILLHFWGKSYMERG